MMISMKEISNKLPTLILVRSGSKGSSQPLLKLNGTPVVFSILTIAHEYYKKPLIVAKF